MFFGQRLGCCSRSDVSFRQLFADGQSADDNPVNVWVRYLPIATRPASCPRRERSDVSDCRKLGRVIESTHSVVRGAPSAIADGSIGGRRFHWQSDRPIRDILCSARQPGLSTDGRNKHNERMVVSAASHARIPSARSLVFFEAENKCFVSTQNEGPEQAGVRL